MNISAINTYNNTRPTFAQNQTEKGLTTKQKAAILSSAAAGMAPVMMFWAKRSGFSLNPLKIIKTPIKQWAIFKYKPVENTIQFEEKEIITVAAGSVAGGFIGGSIVDKENRKAKQREILNQILGNVLVPVGCVGLGSRAYAKYASKIEGAMPQFKETNKFLSGLNKVLSKLPNAGFTLTFLGAGIFLGNRVSNLINEKLYHKKVDRYIKATDFAPHIDDVCMATTMMNKESTFGSKLGRVIPFALLVPGYETGVAQK